MRDLKAQKSVTFLLAVIVYVPECLEITSWTDFYDVSEMCHEFDSQELWSIAYVHVINRFWNDIIMSRF